MASDQGMYIIREYICRNRQVGTCAAPSWNVPTFQPFQLLERFATLSARPARRRRADYDDHNGWRSRQPSTEGTQTLMAFPVTYDPAGSTIGAGPTPGAIALRDWGLAIADQITDLGIYNPRVIAGTNTLSVHAVGRAWDAGTPNGLARAQGDLLAGTLIAYHAELGIQMVIWQRQKWTNLRASQGWRPYNGADPHTSHLHIEITKAASRRLTTEILTTTTGVTMPNPPITFPANRDATIRRVQAAVGTEVDGDPYTLTADAAEALQRKAARLEAEADDREAEVIRLTAEVDLAW